MYLILVLLTFIGTTTIYAVLFWIGLRRVLGHLRDNPDGTAAVTKHVLIPLFGKAQDDDAEE